MPTGQALINLLQSTGAIKYAPGTRPAFTVNFGALRTAFRPEQSAMLTAARAAIAPAIAAGMPAAKPKVTQRTDSGTMTFNVPGMAQPVSFPTIILLGTDGAGARPTLPGLPRRGESVALDERSRSGHILIAAAGNGGLGSDGGTATVIGGNENLIIALGGDGAVHTWASENGSDGGDAIAQGIGEANEINAQGGAGANGTPGAAGSAAVPGWGGILGFGAIPAVPAGPGGKGGAGGNGGKAIISAGDNNLALAQGGTGGSGTTGGPGGLGAPAAALPAGAVGVAGDGGDGGNYKITLGANGVISPASGGGAGGAGGGPAPISPGANGTRE